MKAIYHMRAFYLVVIVGLLTSLGYSARLSAQTAIPISLDEAINTALHRGEEIDLAKGEVRSAEGNEEVAMSGMLPQISASANYTRTLKSQYSGLSSGPDTGAAAALAGLFKNLPFGRLNAYTLGINASQNIFTGGRLTAMNDAARARKQSADIDLTAAQAQLVLNVTQSYYDAILADTIVKISHDALAEADEVYRQTNLAYQVGEKAEFDALRAKVARDNQIPVVLQSEDNRAEAYYRLKQLLNYSLDDSLVLTTPIVDSQARFALMSDTETDQRSSVRQAIDNVTASDAQVRIAESAHWPQISLSSSYSPVAYPSNLFPNWNDWLTNWTAGVTISVPIYTGGNIAGNVDVARAGVEQADARLEQTREAAAMDARTALNQLHSAEANLRSTAGTAAEAQRAYQIANVRFSQGISTEVELDDARIQEEQARANWAGAVRDYQVARAKLSLLKDLPVNPAQAQVASSTAQSAVTQQAASSPAGQSQSSQGLTAPLNQGASSGASSGQ
ncbi:MAG TPA: TolC family protein [Candidatus Kapabacteria bacterium]|nr:TolC family protein [Candidatus Kapabacteria bacterium]